MIKNRVFKNASWLIGVRIVQSFFSLIVTMLTARLLGPSNFGLINYASSIVTFVEPVMNLGFTGILVHEMVTDEDNEGTILGTAILSSLVSSVLCIAGILCFVSIANPGEKVTLIVCALYSLVLVAKALELNLYWYQAHLLSKYTALISFGAYVVISAYKIFLLVTQQSIYWFALSSAFDYLIIALAQFGFYQKLGGKQLRFSADVLKKMLHKSKYYILSGLMISVFAQTDRVMLKIMVDDAAVGFYSAAVACANLTSFVFVAIIDSASPSIFAAKKESETAFLNNTRGLYSVVIYGALLQSIALTLLAKPAIYILYGSDFDPAILALRIIVWYTGFSYIGSARNRWMLAENKQHLIWRIDVSGAAANVLLNYLLIPRFGIYGAAAASLITQIFTNVIVTSILKEVRPSVKLMVQSLNPMVLVQLAKKIR